MTPPARWYKASLAATLGTVFGSDAGGGALARSLITPPGSGSRNGLPAAGARHLDAELVLADVRTVLRDDLALVEDQGPVGQ